MLLVFIFFIIFLIIITIKLKLYIEIYEKKPEIKLKIYILNKLLIGKIDFNKLKRKNFKNKKIQNKIDSLVSDKKKFFKEIYDISKKISLNLEELDLNIDICTTDAILTSYSVAVISNIIVFILKKLNVKINYKKCKFVVNPIYIDKKMLNIKLNCIISVNMVHIINIIYRNFKKWRSDVNGRRASNRRSYGNCNE